MRHNNICDYCGGEMDIADTLASVATANPFLAHDDRQMCLTRLRTLWIDAEGRVGAAEIEVGKLRRLLGRALLLAQREEWRDEDQAELNRICGEAQMFESATDEQGQHIPAREISSIARGEDA